jgi:hypothetical protein
MSCAPASRRSSRNVAAANCLTNVEAGILRRQQSAESSEISSLRQLSKRVNAVSLHGSKVIAPTKIGVVIRKTLAMPKDQLFIERREQGDYSVRRGGTERASAVAPTQVEAIARARELNPDHAPLVERVRNTDVGRRDKAKGLGSAD